MARTGRWITAFLAAVAALVLLGPGAGGSSGAQQDAGKPVFTLRSHTPYVLPEENLPYGSTGALEGVPRLTPAFGNTGTAAAPRGVVLRVDLEDVQFPRNPGAMVHDNCYYGVGGGTVFCEFPDAVPVGTAYETAEPLPWVTSSSDVVEGAYRYSVWPLGDPPPGTEDYKKLDARGSGPALGLVPVAVDSLKGGGELRFAPPSRARADWSVKGITLRGRVGEYVTVGMEEVGHGGDRVRVDLPPGTSFAPLSRAEREGTPSEQYTCGRDDLDGQLYCSNQPNYISLRVRIDRQVEGAVGKVSVREPIRGDTDPTNNSAPTELEITGTAPPGETDPPVETAAPGEAGPGASAQSPMSQSALSDDRRTPGSALAVAASAAALALVTALLTRRKRARRADGPA
ncbi:hypothetical protein [Streptomyces sp. NPDC045369]|uniref:hypothetical protein n=1 Tax=Streptomyces sp. NPDC045369 TaxID=3155732 RepID=UPI0033F9100E